MTELQPTEGWKPWTVKTAADTLVAGPSKAVALVIDSVINSALKSYFEAVCLKAGIGIDFYSVTQSCADYSELFRTRSNVITWNCRMPHSWMTSWGNNVLFIDNSLIAQRSGIFVDSSGFFSNSNLHRDHTWMQRAPNVSEVETFVTRHFRWKPFSGGNKDGPILVCLQNGPDSSLQQEFPACQNAVDRVKATLQMIYDHLPSTRRVIIRPHPRFLTAWAKHEAEYRADCWKQEWETSIGGDVTKIISACSALVAVNSTTVNEALTLGLPVATLGTGVFSDTGVTLECGKDPSRLGGITEFKPDLELCKRYVSNILETHHLPYKIDLDAKNCEVNKWLSKIRTGAATGHLGGHLNTTHVDAGALAWLQGKYGITSMVDIGCGPGGMEQIATQFGIAWSGVDGDPQCRRNGVVTHDFLDGPLATEAFDLAWSVEFLEHVAEAYKDNFMRTFACARFACVTHALPGKKGWHHVNCQMPDYWISVFAKYGFVLDTEATQELRQSSTMKRNFMRHNGLFFRRHDTM